MSDHEKSAPKRIRVSVTNQDIKEAGGPNADKMVVYRWIERGQERETLELNFQKKYDILLKNFENLESEVKEIKSELSKIGGLLMNLVRLQNIATAYPHFEMEVAKSKKRVGNLSEKDAQILSLVEVKEENFKAFFGGLYPNQPSDILISTDIK